MDCDDPCIGCGNSSFSLTHFRIVIWKQTQGYGAPLALVGPFCPSLTARSNVAKRHAIVARGNLIISAMAVVTLLSEPVETRDN